MLNRHHLLSAACVVLALACVKDTPADLHSANERVVRQMVRDLDADGQPDTAVFLRDSTSDEPSVYTRVRVRLSRGGSLSWTGDWGVAPNRVRAALGEDDSSLVTVRADPAGSEIVQYGAAYSCCSPALLVSRIDRAGLRAQIELPEFEVRELGGDTAGVSFLTGAPCLAEMVGEAVSYQPWIVIRLVAPFGIDSVASEARTRQAAGGYAGLGCRDDVDVIRENGRPKLRVRVEARRR